MHCRSALALLAFALLGPAAAADVLVVDDSGGAGVDHTTLSAAVAAAQDGDVLLVKSGTYSGPTIVDGKGLAICADKGASVVHDGRLAFVNLAAGQRALLSGFALTPPGDFSAGALEIFDCAGFVQVQDVVADGGSGFLTAFVPHMVGIRSSAAVVLTRVTASGGTRSSPASEGIWAKDSALYLYDCHISGGVFYGGLAGMDGGPGTVLDGGTLFATATTIGGGPGKPVGSEIFGCDGTSGAGGDGLVVTNAGVADLFGVTLLGGAPGALVGVGSCTQGPPGDPLVLFPGATAHQTPWPERHFVVASPVRSNEAIDVKLTGRPGDLAWIVFSSQPTLQTIAPVVGPLLVGTPVLVPLGVLPTGEISFQTVTFVPPGFEALVYYAQPLFVDGVGATLGEPAPIVEVSFVF
jgi:hypothetical protein